jgi:hypothetical protein
MTFTTGSQSLQNNIFLGGTNINHPSASIGANSTLFNSNINVGNVSSIATSSLLTLPIQFNNNINAHPALTLNSFSSSLTTTNNIFGGGAGIFVNNRFSNTGSNNNFVVSANLISGQNITINANGTPATNTPRGVVGNLVGGQNVIVSAEGVGTDLGGLRNSFVYGFNLNISGSHSAANTTQQGAAFVGRWNSELDGLADSARTVLAVGSGTGAGNRRTSLYVTSGSLVGVSGSLDVKGNTTITGSANITHNIAGQPALTVSGSLNASSSFDHVIIGNQINITGNTQMSGNGGFPLTVDGTISSKRFNFNGNPFNTNLGGTFGSINYDGTNTQLSMVNGDFSTPATNSAIYVTTNTGSNFTNVLMAAEYGGTSAILNLQNTNGNRNVSVQTDTMTVTGSLNVTGSVSIADAGDLTMYGHKMFNVGDFYSTETQSGSANVSGSVTYNNTGISNGVTLASNSRLTIANSGVYSITFSAQLKETGGTDTVYLWLKKNGTNVADTGTKTVVRNNDENIMTVEYIVQAAANDYYEIVFQNVNGHAQLHYEAASGNIPATPSIITTVKQVR